jgi:hypothetical protein
MTIVKNFQHILAYAKIHIKFKKECKHNNKHENKN